MLYIIILDIQETNQKSELVVWAGHFENETGFCWEFSSKSPPLPCILFMNRQI